MLGAKGKNKNESNWGKDGMGDAETGFLLICSFCTGGRHIPYGYGDTHLYSVAYLEGMQVLSFVWSLITACKWPFPFRAVPGGGNKIEAYVPKGWGL